MKKVKCFFTSLVLVVTTGSAYSQFNTDALQNKYNETMPSSVESAKQQALAVVKDTSTSNSDKLKNAQDALKKLEIAKQSHELLKKSTAKKPANKDLQEKEEKQHTEATKYGAELKEELSKQTPDNIKVNDLTNKLTASVGEMEKYQKLLKGVTK